MTGPMDNVRVAVRVLRRHWHFTAVAAAVMAIGIGTTTSAFTLVDALLLRPLPVKAPDSLYLLSARTEQGGEQAAFTSDEYETVRDAVRPISDVEAMAFETFRLRADRGDEAIWGMVVSEHFFAMLGLAPAVGGFFSAGDAGRTQDVVLGYQFWTRRFGGNRSVLGQTVLIDGQEARIVGVTPRGFAGLRVGTEPEVWVPMSLAKQAGTSSASLQPDRQFEIVGRRTRGQSAGQVEAEIGRLLPRVQRSGGDAARWIGAKVGEVGGMSPTRLAFIGIVLTPALLVLGIAGVNLAGMLTARAMLRRREVAICLAIGAGRGRLVRQFLWENVLTTAIGGVLGLLCSIGLSPLLLQLPLPIGISIAADLTPDWRILVFCAATTVTAGLIFGLAPAAHAVRSSVQGVLNETGRAATGATGRIQSALVVIQIGLSFLLIVCAGLMLRTLHKANSTDVGFEPHRLWVASAAGLGTDSSNATGTFATGVLDQAGAEPGVAAVGLGTAVPMVQPAQRTTVRSGDDSSAVEYAIVAGKYFEALGLPLLRGRTLTAGDGVAGQPRAAVVNSALARRLWPKSDPIGQTLIVAGQPLEVVGISGDAKYDELTEPTQPFLYLPYSGQPNTGLYLLARADRGTANLESRLRRLLARSVPDGMIVVQPFSQAAAAALLPQRMAATLASIFGGLGIVLAVTGLYALVAYSTNQRTRELGLRIAIGASPASILRLIVGRALRLAAAGAALGIVLAYAGTTVLRHLLFGVGIADPVTYTLALTLVVAAALVAAYGPARRAMAIDPGQALRPE